MVDAGIQSEHISLTARELPRIRRRASNRAIAMSLEERVRAALAEQRIKAAFRGTAIRFSTHVYNDEADIELAARVIGPLVTQPVGSR